MTHDLTQDPAVQRWFEHHAQVSTDQERSALVAAVVAAHEQRYPDLLALWSTWKEARHSFQTDRTRDKDLYYRMMDSEAALAAWGQNG